MKLSFLGAAREVTGSCILVETINTRFLVDCGIVQDGRDPSARNRRPFDFDPATVDFVLLTNAHIDHSGLLPKLTSAGFKGPIYATPATIDLLRVILPNSAHIQESEATRQIEKNTNLYVPPFYSVRDTARCLRQAKAVEYEQEFSPNPMVRCRFCDAGYIPGSSIIEVWVTEYDYPSKLVFSGDLGQPGRPMLRDYATIEDADILVIESTYGNRRHPDSATTENEVVSIIDKTLHERRGNVVIPAFAVGRTQQLIYQLHRLIQAGRLQAPRIFVDSPMANEAARVTRRQAALMDEALVGPNALDGNLPYLQHTASVEASTALNEIRSGAIIIAPSATCEVGRIRHHLRQNLPRRECSILMTEYQPQGTRGRSLVDGVRRLRLFGEDIEVQASVFAVDGLSGHADQTALLRWAAAFRRPPAQTFVVHGEPPAAQALADTLSHNLDWQVSVPDRGQAIRWPDFLSAP